MHDLGTLTRDTHMRRTWLLLSVCLFAAGVGTNYIAQVYNAPRLLIVTTGVLAMLGAFSTMAWIVVGISNLLEEISTNTTIPMYKKLYGRKHDGKK